MDRSKRWLEEAVRQRDSGEKGKQGGDWKYHENSLILKTPIMCTTLSMAGIERLEITSGSIDYLIVDEACQAIEPSCLIPFSLNPKRIILVGDQNQLPATTFSENSMQTNFARSLFERLLLSGHEKTMLTVQYRMHPLIRDFPSRAFYDGKITDGDNVVTRRLDNEMTNLAKLARRVAFFDLLRSRESVSDKSKINNDETKFTLALVKCITLIASPVRGFRALAGKIAVVTPYKA